jgi:DNA polymerase-3 subunit delta'
MNLSNIFCQSKAINTLQRAYAAQKIPHSYIFAGPGGVGKFTTARSWAKLLLCQSPVKNMKNSTEPRLLRSGHSFFSDSCGGCDSCRKFDADSHPDFHHIYKELTEFVSDPQIRKRTPIDLPIIVVREFVIGKVQIKPVLSPAKVFVISEAERLNLESQNALLKTLEEPPHQSFIILLCTKLDSLLPTTRSRCQIVRFSPVGEEEIITHLAASGIDKNEAKFLARWSGGSIGRAELLAKLEPRFYEIKKQFLNRISTCRLADCVELAQWINSAASQLAKSYQELKAGTSASDISRQVKKDFVLILSSALMDAMKQLFTAPQDMVNFDQPEQIKIIARTCDPQKCSRLIEDCYLASRFIDASVNEKLIFEHLLLNFHRYSRIQPA